MLAKKKKIGKKNIKEDKLVTFYSKTLQYYEVYKNQVLIGAAALIVIIAAIVYFANQSQKTEIEAASALAKAERTYQSGNYQNVVDGVKPEGSLSLVEVVDKYSGTEAGEMARIYLANSYFYIGDFEKALETYEDYSGSNKLYKATALAGMAGCYEAMGQFDKAAKYFRDAANTYSNNALNSNYLLNAAVNYISSEKYSDAKSILETLKEKYTSSEEAREADRYLAEVKLHSKS